DQDDVDRLGIEAGGGQGRGQQPDRRTEAGAIAGIDQHELGAGVDYDRIERRDDAALRHIGGLGGRKYLLVTDIAHELGGERNGARAVIDDGDFELADLAAIEARRLPAGERGGGWGGRGEWREGAGGGGRDGGGNDAATGQFGHGVLRKAARRARGHGGRRPSPMLLIQGARQKAVPRRIMGTSCRNAEPRHSCYWVGGMPLNTSFCIPAVVCAR